LSVTSSRLFGYLGRTYLGNKPLSRLQTRHPELGEVNELSSSGWYFCHFLCNPFGLFKNDLCDVQIYSNPAQNIRCRAFEYRTWW